jgi:hypothetical protein
MIEFVIQNPLLILGIAGTVISFVISLSEFVSRRTIPKFVVFLVILGFLTLLGQQVLEYFQKQNAERIAAAEKILLAANEETRTKIIQQIQSNVQMTRITVESISARLETVPLASLGNEFVTIGNAELSEAEVFAKGAPEAWPRYADWLRSESEGGKESSLTLTLNANGSYQLGLLLAYVMTSNTTQADIAGVIRSGGWYKFPSSEFLARHGTDVEGVRWILFFDRQPSNLVAYAEATSLANELLAYQQAGLGGEIEHLLNDPQPDPAQALAGKLASVRTQILHEANTQAIVRSMLERQIPVAAVVGDDGHRYLVRLERVIKLATQTN